MERSVEAQGRALIRGLYSVIFIIIFVVEIYSFFFQILDKEYLRIFDAEQLKLILSGTLDIDIEDWRENTEYKGGYYDGHVVI